MFQDHGRTGGTPDRRSPLLATVAVGSSVAALLVLGYPGAAAADPDRSLTVGVPRVAHAGEAWAGIVDVRRPGIHQVLSEQQVAGVQPNDLSYARFGSAVLVTDLDADGYDDLIVGAPGYPGRTSEDVPGRVDLLFGTSAGISEERAVTLTTPALGGDEFGSALALSARADADSGQDLWIGAPGHDVGAAADAGAVFRYLITPGGTASYLETITQNSPTIWGKAETGDRFGAVLSGHTVNGAVVGIPDEDIGTLEDAGSVQRIRTEETDNTLNSGVSWNQDSPGVPGVAEAGDRFGASLAWAGSVVGVPGEDVGRIKNAGLVQTFGFSGGGQTLVPSVAYTQDSKGVPGRAEAGDRFGAAVSSGIFQCDEQTSAAIGAPGENIGRIADAGSVTVVIQPALSGLTLAQCPAQVFSQGHGLSGAAEAGDRVGASMGVRLGDQELEDAQRDSVLVGVPREDVGKTYDAGRVLLGVGRDSTGYGYQGGPQPAMRYGSVLPS